MLIIFYYFSKTLYYLKFNTQIRKPKIDITQIMYDIFRALAVEMKFFLFFFNI